MVQEKLDKAILKQIAITKIFNKRCTKAVKEYLLTVVDTIYETQVVSYRGNLFNPLGLKPESITGVHVVEPDTIYANALDRFVRCMEDIQEVTGHLTYILNFVETSEEFLFIVFSKQVELGSRKEVVTSFMSTIPERLTTIRKLLLLSEMV